MTPNLDLLAAEITGDIITPTDPGYSESKKSFLVEFDSRRPVAVVRPSSAMEVSKVIRFARDNHVDLAVRAGGHSVLGYSSSENGLVLDLASLRNIDINPADRTAWADGGVLAGEYTKATAEHGLVTGFGDVPTVGIAGITLGGGIGFLHRKLGITADSLIGAEIVTADGEIRFVDSTNDPDLFWAIRGGGGNFGVATRLGYRLHPVGPVHGGTMILPATPGLIADFVTIAREASNDLSVIAGVAVAPPMPFLPEEVHGTLIMMSYMVHAGEAAEEEVGQFRKLAKPLVDDVSPIPFLDMYAGDEGPPPPYAAMSIRSVLSDEFGVDEAGAAIEALSTSSADTSILQIRVLGGEVASVPLDATAFAHRDRGMVLNVVAAYQDPAIRPEHEEWVTGLSQQLQNGGAGAYVNFSGDDSPAGLSATYPGSTGSRLAEVKTKYDPDNFFRSNLNIRPHSES